MFWSMIRIVSITTFATRSTVQSRILFRKENTSVDATVTTTTVTSCFKRDESWLCDAMLTEYTNCVICTMDGDGEWKWPEKRQWEKWKILFWTNYVCVVRVVRFNGLNVSRISLLLQSAEYPKPTLWRARCAPVAILYECTPDVV